MRIGIRALTITSLVFILGLALTITSCEDAVDQEDTAEVNLSKIVPADGSLNVAPDASIRIEFTEGMDINSCQSRFGVYMGDLDDIPTNMMGQMHGMMTGQYQWNDEQTVMIFYPDSMFMDSTMYSICLQEGMRMHHHGGGGMMGMNHMSNNGSAATNGIISKFRTVN